MGKISDVHLEDELQRSYIDYAMSVIIGRAIPDVRDGLKPVQRRILYAMYKIGNTSNQPTKKSARVVGEVIAKYHPHGDVAVYETLVRMAQDFSMNHTLAEGQGNFSSLDGDPPAAMRYTEVRLTKFAEEMLEDIDKETVEFVPNFDNTETEPLILPSKIPNLLVNGSSGIAVGVATNMLPHNLAEVCDAVLYLLDKPDASIDEVLSIIKGPDFPTGGIAVMTGNAINGYKYGKGQLTVKAKMEVEDKRNIVVTEIPYGVNKSTLVRSIVDAAKEKKVQGIADVRDESDRSGIRIFIELKKEADPASVMNALYKYTQLEITVPIINLAVLGTSLKSFNILQLLNAFISYRREIVKKRSIYELKVAKDKKEITDGLMLALSSIEDIVKTIRESEGAAEAKDKLISMYKLSERQAAAVLEMKLSRLTHLERSSLERESKELADKIAHYTEIINSPEKIDGEIKREMQEIKSKYAKKRKTEIVKVDTYEEISDEDTISNEPTTVIFTSGGYIKRLSTENYREQARGGKGVIAINLKEGDYVKQIVNTHTKDYLLCVSDKGRIYWLKVYNIPESNKYAEGKHISNLIATDGNNERIVCILSISDFENSKILFLTHNGVIKKTSAKFFSRPRATGIKAIKIVNDSVVDAISYSDAKYIIITTRKGKAIRFGEPELRIMGRNSFGVRGIRLSNNDAAVNVIVTGDAGHLLTVTENGYGKLTEVGKYREQSRGGKGVRNIKISDKTGDVTKSVFVKNEPRAVLINSNGITITFSISSIRITGRSAMGVRLMRLPPGAKVVDVMLMVD